MPISITTDIATTSAAAPLTINDNVIKHDGVHFGTSLANVGVIIASAGLKSHMRQGQRVTLDEDEAGVERIWNATAQNLRSVSGLGQQLVQIAGDNNIVRATTGAPAIGSELVGDIAVDRAAGTYYLKGASAWGPAVSYAAAAAAAATAYAGLSDATTANLPAINTPLTQALAGKAPASGIARTALDATVQASLGKADAALQSAPVSSVNGKTGVVALTAADVGAATAAQGAKADTALQAVPIATATTLGGIKGSASIVIAADGVASATASAAALPTQVPFSTTVPLDGLYYMAQQSVAAPYAFVPGAMVPGGRCQITLVADGVNVPTFGQAKKTVSSAAWDNTLSGVNEVVFNAIGGRVYYAIMQASPLEIYVLEQYVKMSTLVNFAEAGSASVGYTYTSTSAALASSASAPSLSLAGDGYIKTAINGTAGGQLMALHTAATIADYTTAYAAIYTHSSGNYKILESGANTAATVGGVAVNTAILAGDSVQIQRTGSALAAVVIRANGSQVIAHNFTITNSARLYPVIAGVLANGVSVGPIKIKGGS